MTEKIRSRRRCKKDYRKISEYSNERKIEIKK
jgi:hypothetical protein